MKMHAVSIQPLEQTIDISEVILGAGVGLKLVLKGARENVKR